MSHEETNEGPTDETQDDVDCDNDMEESIDPPLQSIKMYKEAVRALEDVQEFLYGRGHTREAEQIGPCINALVSLQISSTRQTTLADFFS